jgi:hypothetical protein
MVYIWNEGIEKFRGRSVSGRAAENNGHAYDLSTGMTEHTHQFSFSEYGFQRMLGGGK